MKVSNKPTALGALLALQVQEVTSLTGKGKLSEATAWLAEAPESQAKDRVKALLAGWSDNALTAVMRDYRSRVYGIYDLAVGPDVRAEWTNDQYKAFVGQFGIIPFFSGSAR